MKKIYAFATATFLTFGLTAQVQKLAIESQDISGKTVPVFNQQPSQNSALPETQTIIWSDDFSDTTNWMYVGGADEWTITTSLSANLVGQGFDATMNSTSGGNFAFIDSDASGGGATQDAYLEYAGSIDCSANAAVRLTFETYLRQYVEIREVLVSNDNGASWDTYTVLTQFGTNTTSPNVTTEVVDITPTAGNQANVKIKFHYVGAWDWFWTIDDVMLVTPPANELTFVSNYYQTLVDTATTLYYSSIPLSQAVNDVVEFSAVVMNTGGNSQVNTVFENFVSTPSGSSTMTSNSVTIPYNTSDSLIIGSTFSFNQGLGSYSWAFTASSDSSVAGVPSTMMDTVNIEVTDSTYARDFNAGGNSWYGAGSSFEIGPLYTIFDSVKATSVTVRVGAASADGETFSIYIYDNDFNLVVSREFITYDSTNNAGVDVAYSIPETILAPGQYIVTFKTYTDALYFTRSSMDADPQTVFVDPSAGGTWFYTSSIPVVRLNVTSNLFVCDLAATALQTGNNTAEVTASAGTAPYSYLWDNGETTAIATTLTSSLAGTTHMVTVTDDSACVVTASALIVSGLIEAGIKGDVSIYPNPNNGNFQLNLEGVFAGEYDLTVTNIIGQVVYKNVLNVNGNYNGNVELSNMQSGIYFMEIANNNGEKSVIRFIVK